MAPQRRRQREVVHLDLAARRLLGRALALLSCSGVGLRTATAQLETPRIITPSSTA